MGVEEGTRTAHSGPCMVLPTNRPRRKRRKTMIIK
jgi:hypothetical protein